MFGSFTEPFSCLMLLVWWQEGRLAFKISCTRNLQKTSLGDFLVPQPNLE